MCLLINATRYRIKKLVVVSGKHEINYQWRLNAVVFSALSAIGLIIASTAQFWYMKLEYIAFITTVVSSDKKSNHQILLKMCFLDQLNLVHRAF